MREMVLIVIMVTMAMSVVIIVLGFVSLLSREDLGGKKKSKRELKEEEKEDERMYLEDTGRELWLVPGSVFDEVDAKEFGSAMRKLRNAGFGQEILWDKRERAAFWKVWTHHKVWRPL